MNLVNNTRQSFLILLLIFSFAATQAQSFRLTEVSDVHTVSIDKDTAPDLDWGITKLGSVVRAKVEFTNTLGKQVTLVRVLASEGCYIVGSLYPLRNVKVEPGQTQEFFVIAKGDELGEHTYNVELILEDEKGIRSRRGVFQFRGSVDARE